MAKKVKGKGSKKSASKGKPAPKAKGGMMSEKGEKAGC